MMSFLITTIYAIVIFSLTVIIYADEIDHRCKVNVTKFFHGRNISLIENFCCDGYNDDGNGNCMPVCKETCKRGFFCKAPNSCECKTGYVAENEDCIPKCEKECIDGYCIKPNVCHCPDDFEFEVNSTNICVPKCKEKCGKYSKCTKSKPPTPNRCQCLTGYIENKTNGKCEPVCKNKCINGFCSAPDTCSCFEGYNLDAKNKSLCKPICTPACSEYYTCITPNKCEIVCTDLVENSICIKPPNIWKCKPGYQHDLKIDKCVLESCICESNGYCLENKDECICYDDMTKNLTTGQCEPVCQPECQNSLCVDNNVCECLEGFHKTQKNHVCEDDDFCNGVPCKNGECNRMGKCRCKLGFYKSLSYDGHTQCDNESTFIAKIMSTIIVVPLLLACFILIAVCVIAKKKTYNIEEQEMMLIRSH